MFPIADSGRLVIHIGTQSPNFGSRIGFHSGFRMKWWWSSSLIQMTFDRFSTIAEPENFWVVTNAKYVDIVREQLPEIPAENILAEPAARNTAPCVAWAGWRILQKDPDANIVVTPADTVILNVSLFRNIIGEALNYTRDTDAIVTLGIVPNRPETGYGYVEVADSIIGNVRFFESSNNIVHMESCKRVVIQGIHDCILSEKNGQILICHRSEEQRIKEFSAE